MPRTAVEAVAAVAPVGAAAVVAGAQARHLSFTKMHGAGNDFVVLDRRPIDDAARDDGAGAHRAADSLDAALCRAIANRHFGVGCDQILTVEPPLQAGAVAAYCIWNADGSAAGQCGNGARCVAAWLLRDAAARGTPLGSAFVLDSPAGRHAVALLDDGALRIAMGAPRFAPADVPLLGFDAAQDAYALDIDGAAVRVGAVSMGNPHAVLEVDDIAAAPVAQLGAALQRHGAFRDSVNVGFAQVLARDHIQLRVFERGVGETLACGSGACAAAVVLMRRGRVDRTLTVSLPGGDLQIAWPSDEAPVSMAGPATFVFDGQWLA